MADRLPISAKARHAILKKHGNMCDSCGCKDNLVIHHILPVKLGGTNKETNLAVLCYKCHQIVHNGISFRTLRETNAVHRPGHKLGRPTVFTRSDAEDYLFCRISTLEIRTQRNKTSHIGDSVPFKELCKELGVVAHKNNVGAIKSLSNPDHVVGYVIYSDGRKEEFYLKDTFRYQKSVKGA